MAGARLRLGCCARLARVGLFRSAKTNRHGKTVELSPGSEGSTHLSPGMSHAISASGGNSPRARSHSRARLYPNATSRD